MEKAIFFSGEGTAFRGTIKTSDCLELYPETLPALRLLARRGFGLFLVTPQYQEYRWFKAALKDKTLPLGHFDPEKTGAACWGEVHSLDWGESYYITDGRYLKLFAAWSCKIILVLSGCGVSTLASAGSDLQLFADVCKDIYAAAFSAAAGK
ncbi:MAG: hypothetical protein QHH10_03245 [Peptococcaceae bacterium]|jgi:hypothetical protein|nr:hypothetical protein [Peptococcaceae bacterium]MDH7524312.1 hypothetical protein [Peptococcaceae bacterium]